MEPAYHVQVWSIHPRYILNLPTMSKYGVSTPGIF